MLKINNKGWSLNTMIILILVLILTVILVSLLVYNFGIEKNSPNPLFNNQNQIISEE